MGSIIRWAKVGGYCTLVLALSGLLNVLALTGALYMLQVYDRVLASKSVPTLIALSVLIAGVYLAFGMIDMLRGQILYRIGLKADRLVMPHAHRALIEARQRGQGPDQAVQSIRDADGLRLFLGSQAPHCVLDLLWVPLYLGFLWLISPELAMLAGAGILVLVMAAALAGFSIRRREATATALSQARMALVDGQLRNSDPLAAMGLGPSAVNRLAETHSGLVDAQTRVVDAVGGLGAAMRVLRLMLHSAIIGLGAYLVIENQMTVGAIIAASIAAGRAIMPIDGTIASWSAIVTAVQSAHRLARLVGRHAPRIAGPGSNAALSSLELRDVSVERGRGAGLALEAASLMLRPGQAALVLGSSGAGKTTLLEAAAGLTEARGGMVLLDGARRTLSADSTGIVSTGYLPQDAAIFPGTIGENIAFLRDAGDLAGIRRAAQLFGLNELIQSLPHGYDTRIAEIIHMLTPGLRQRLALARAFYGEPVLVMLDDPTTHLDTAGEAAVVRAIRQVRARGGIVLVTATRTALLPAVDHLAVLQNGRLVSFGPKTDVLTRFRGNQDRPAEKPDMATANGGGA